jgi:2-methylcitrate dehydratase PrpD
MKFVIRNGTVVTPRARYSADLVCEDGLITALEGPNSAFGADEEIDATGLLVFPGFIDPHVHSRDPGLTEKEDFAHSTQAAASGGITTIFGHTGPAAFAPDERVAELAQRVEVRAAGDLEGAWPDAAPARVTVHTRDGDRAKRVDNPRGHHSNPVELNELRAKFELLVGGADPGRLYERLLGIREVEDVSTAFEGVV